MNKMVQTTRYTHMTYIRLIVLIIILQYSTPYVNFSIQPKNGRKNGIKNGDKVR